MESAFKPRNLILAIGGAAVLAACAAPRPYDAPPSGQPYPQQQPQYPQGSQGPAPRPRSTTGAGVGALAGAVIGAISGDDARERRNRALIGAGVGAIAGAGVGTYMDRQEARMREEMRDTGVQVVRQGDDLVLNMPESITFGFDSSDLNPASRNVLNRVANVAIDYPQTLLEIAGHTDSIGSDAYNDRLSERRAQAVGTYLQQQRIPSNRLLMIGAGKRYPIASNDTDAGRAQNRRVEITFMPVRE